MSRRSGKINVHRPTTPIVAMPPSTIAGPTPSSAAATPLSNDPTSLEAPMNTFSTADTRPRIAIGRGERDDRRADEHAHRVGAGEHHERDERDRVAAASARAPPWPPRTPRPTTSSHRPTSSQRAHRQQHGDHDRPDARCGAQPAVADVADVETILGDRRQQRHRSTEQHGEQVEGDRPEQHRLPADEPQSLERVSEGSSSARPACVPAGGAGGGWRWRPRTPRSTPQPRRTAWPGHGRRADRCSPGR